MLDFLSRKRPESPRALLELIVKAFPNDREKALRVFHAAILDDRRYVTDIITAAFDAWSSSSSPPAGQ